MRRSQPHVWWPTRTPAQPCLLCWRCMPRHHHQDIYLPTGSLHRLLISLCRLDCGYRLECVGVARKSDVSPLEPCCRAGMCKKLPISIELAVSCYMCHLHLLGAHWVRWMGELEPLTGQSGDGRLINFATGTQKLSPQAWRCSRNCC